MDVSFYLSPERHSRSFPDWDMKPGHFSIPSPFCIPKGKPAARFSKDTPGTHIHTKHSSLRTAAGILQCPFLQPDRQSISARSQSCTTLLKKWNYSSSAKSSSVFFFSAVSVSSVFFIHFRLTLSYFLVYLQADQTLASAAFSILPEARELHNPLISPKDNIWQQDRPPAAPVAIQADQYLAGAVCCPGDNEQGWMDGQRIWEEDLDTATHPVCQHYGSSGPNVYSLALTHSCLVICLWASPLQTHTRIKGNVFNILSNIGIYSVLLDYKSKREKTGHTWKNAVLASTCN